MESFYGKANPMFSKNSGRMLKAKRAPAAVNKLESTRSTVDSTVYKQQEALKNVAALPLHCSHESYEQRLTLLATNGSNFEHIGNDRVESNVVMPFNKSDSITSAGEIKMNEENRINEPTIESENVETSAIGHFQNQCCLYNAEQQTENEAVELAPGNELRTLSCKNVKNLIQEALLTSDKNEVEDKTSEENVSNSTGETQNLWTDLAPEESPQIGSAVQMNAALLDYLSLRDKPDEIDGIRKTVRHAHHPDDSEKCEANPGESLEKHSGLPNEPEPTLLDREAIYLDPNSLMSWSQLLNSEMVPSKPSEQKEKDEGFLRPLNQDSDKFASLREEFDVIEDGELEAIETTSPITES